MILIDSCSIAKIILDLKKRIINEDYVTYEEIYEIRLLIQKKLDAKDIEIQISDEIDYRVFEERNGLLFYIGDKTNMSIDAYYLGAKDWVSYFTILGESKEEIVRTISKIKLSKIELIDAYLSMLTKKN